MATITDTEHELLRRYADDVAFVAEEQPATDLDTFAEQLTTAAERLNDVDISGGDEVDTAATILADSTNADLVQRPVLLARAAQLLRIAGDAFSEYRSDAS